MSQQPLFVPASDGWYARPGDPPGIARHWDGKTWQCEIRGPIKDHFNHLRSIQPEQRSPEDQDLLKRLTSDVSTIEDLVLGNPSDNPPLVPIQAPPPYIPPPTASYAPTQPMYAGPPPMMPPRPGPAPMPPMYAGPPPMYQGQPPMMPPQRGPVQPPMMQPGPTLPPVMPPQPVQPQFLMPQQPGQPMMPPRPATAQTPPLAAPASAQSPTMAPPAPVLPQVVSPQPASVQTPVTAPPPAPVRSMTPQWPTAVQPPAMATQPASAQSPTMPPPPVQPAMMPQPVPQPAPVQPMMTSQPGPAPLPPAMPLPQPAQAMSAPYGMPPFGHDAPEFAAPAPKRKARKALLVVIPVVVVLALLGIGYSFRSKLPFVSGVAALSVNSCVTLSTPAGSTETNAVTWTASDCSTSAAGPVSYIVVSKMAGAAQCDPDSQYVQTLSGSKVDYTYCLMENLAEGQCVYEDANGLMFEVPCTDTRAMVKVGVRADQGTGYSCPAEMTAWRFPAGNRTYCLTKP